MDSIKIINYTELENSFYSSKRTVDTTVESTVSTILQNVHSRGDKALVEYVTQFDKIALETFEIPKEDLQKAEQNLKAKNPALYNALQLSFNAALTFAKKQRECFTDFETEIHSGMITAQKTIPVQTAGIYVPAGRYPLLSTVIMGVSPALAAGVKNIILCTPPRPHPSKQGEPFADEGILATASLCGVERVFAIGGAQAIGAMAYGTKSIPRADVIAGPGNAFVAEAKRQIFGDAGIDMLAGPTEVLIIADDSARPDWVASDLLAQAEHDVQAQAVLVTWSKKLAKSVQKEIDKQLQTLATAKTAQESIKNHSCIILTETAEQAVEIANKKAPEHLELALDAGELRNALEKSVHNYGSLFVGHIAAEVFGDYSAGLNHTLPTSGSARFTGGLSVRHFLKTCTVLKTIESTSVEAQKKAGLQKAAHAAYLIGKAEGLEAHAQAALNRFPQKN